MLAFVPSRPKQEIDFSKAVPRISEENPALAEDFTAHDAQGKPVRLSDFKGKPILLNFWGSWCPPCVEELPSLLKFSDWATKNLGVAVLAVSIDEGWDPIHKLFNEKKFWPGADLPLTILLDTDARSAVAYGTTKYPETFFINRDFKVIRKFEGPQDWTSQEIKKWVEERSK